jgi:hypothetical protein
MSAKVIPLGTIGRKHDLTIDELRERESFRNYTEAELIALINTIKVFTQVAYGIWSQNCNTSPEQKADSKSKTAVTIKLKKSATDIAA